MRKQQSGFTLIELIAVMVILGILAATALPRFVDLSSSANNAVTSATAGSIESSSSLNYAVAVANQAGLTTDTYVGVTACNLTSVNRLLTEELESTEYRIQTVDAFPGRNLGDTATCSITQRTEDDAIVQEFLLIYVPNPPAS